LNVRWPSLNSHATTSGHGNRTMRFTRHPRLRRVNVAVSCGADVPQQAPNAGGFECHPSYRRQAWGQSSPATPRQPLQSVCACHTVAVLMTHAVLLAACPASCNTRGRANAPAAATRDCSRSHSLKQHHHLAVWRVRKQVDGHCQHGPEWRAARKSAVLLLRRAQLRNVLDLATRRVAGHVHDAL
jgi:hypothetical protein